MRPIDSNSIPGQICGFQFGEAEHGFNYNPSPEMQIVDPAQRMFPIQNRPQIQRIIPYIVPNNIYPESVITYPIIQNIVPPQLFYLSCPERNVCSTQIDSKHPLERKANKEKGQPIFQKEEIKKEAKQVKEIKNRVNSLWNSSDFIIIREKELKIDFSMQVYEADIFHACNSNETKLKCKFCEFIAENRRSLGGHVSRHHPNTSENYRKIQLRRNTKERIRSRTKLLLAKIEYFKKVKNLDYFADCISEKWKTKYKAMINKNIFRKIRDGITEEMVTNYLEHKELKIKTN